MRTFITLVVLFVSLAGYTQPAQTLSVFDFVKIKDGHRAEAIFYYENNWKAAREIALKKGFIKSYTLVETKADSAADFDLILITEFKDSAQLNNVEKNFQLVFKEIGNNGPMLLNDLKPAAFRQNVFMKNTITLFEAPRRH